MLCEELLGVAAIVDHSHLAHRKHKVHLGRVEKIRPVVARAVSVAGQGSQYKKKWSASISVWVAGQMFECKNTTKKLGVN